MVARLHGYIEIHRIVHSKWTNGMVCELYLNTVQKMQESNQAWLLRGEAGAGEVVGVLQTEVAGEPGEQLYAY